MDDDLFSHKACALALNAAFDFSIEVLGMKKNDIVAVRTKSAALWKYFNQKNRTYYSNELEAFRAKCRNSNINFHILMSNSNQINMVQL